MKKAIIFLFICAIFCISGCGGDDAPQWPIAVEPEEFIVNEETGLYRIQVLSIEQEQLTPSYLRKDIEVEIVSVPDETYQKSPVLRKGLSALVLHAEVLPETVAVGDHTPGIVTAFLK